MKFFKKVSSMIFITISEVSCSYYGIQADEVSDASNTEQLGIINYDISRMANL